MSSNGAKKLALALPCGSCIAWGCVLAAVVATLLK
jgi:hypothetical protein